MNSACTHSNIENKRKKSKQENLSFFTSLSTSPHRNKNGKQKRSLSFSLHSLSIPPPLSRTHSLLLPYPLDTPSRRDPLRRLPKPGLHQRPKVPDEALDGPGRGVAEGADGVSLDLLGDLFF